MEYDHPARRRARAARRLLGAGLRPEVWRGGTSVEGYWWDGHENFGDAMTPWLLPRYGVVPIHREPARARFVGVGSILEFLPEAFDGLIWGSGLMHETPRPLPDATVLAVRGRLTHELLGSPPVRALGDPGLLVARHRRRRAPRWQLGIAAHGHHRDDAHLRALAAAHPGRVRLIDVNRSVPRVVHDITSCGAVLATSLHGLITADAFGIPAAWFVWSPALSGGDFKFRDYESVVSPGSSRRFSLDPEMDVDQLVRETAQVSATSVADCVRALEAATHELQRIARQGARFPAATVRQVLDRG
ncbi:polysaccharide pyruvyl transferase family protein [Intrasporangium calvum]|uniref:Polysaccharide pyruvyl transferase family protein n=1 Tax=Intrasporangium calvum TaxID=53358 RepID=A0ABT5GHR3_9MICO|nr:polysaccharide pyruvyl transferase family protein [Intrasporangium calvum]MDC5697682.1 polysaccharide pyruvyl transferase family protein [Intrasporangium calvum]